MIYILFGILLHQPDGIHNYFLRFETKASCISERKAMEIKYGLDNFSGFCVKEVR